MEEYSAAHSMDTFWYAVDGAGHVGYFSTGEGGAFPDKANDDAREEVWQHVLEPRPGAGSRYDLRGFLNPPPRQDVERHACRARGWDGEVLMFLASLDPVKGQIAAGQAIPVNAGPEAAVVFRYLAYNVARRLHKKGSCLGCFFLEQYAEGGLERVTQAGLHVYCHPTYYYSGRSRDCVTGLYGRVAVPTRSLHVDQLPPQVRRVVSRVRMDDICFSETPHIQPCERGSVESENAAYLTLDGRTIRRITSNVWDYASPEQYRTFHDWLLGEDCPWLEGILITPPSEEKE
jgi:hypothetical protein